MKKRLLLSSLFAASSLYSTAVLNASITGKLKEIKDVITSPSQEDDIYKLSPTSWAVYDKHNNPYTISWIKEGDLSEEEKFFESTLIKVYKNIPANRLNCVSKEAFFKDTFNNIKSIFNKHENNNYFLRVTYGGVLAAFAWFHRDGDIIYIKEVVVDPHLWNEALAKEIVFAPLKVYPEARKIIAVLSAENKAARDFYTRGEVGFSQTVVPADYNPDLFVAYEYVIR